jgi:hypothetical protein
MVIGQNKMAQRSSCAFPNEKFQAAQTVSSAKDFYDYADEHFGWAETAKTERERTIFFQMAAAWLEVAQRWETSAMNTGAKRCHGARFSLGAHTVGSPSAPVDQGGQACAEGSI